MLYLYPILLWFTDPHTVTFLKKHSDVHTYFDEIFTTLRLELFSSLDRREDDVLSRAWLSINR